MQDSRPILLVEDDDIDAMTVQRALKDLGSQTKWFIRLVAKRRWNI
jgi:CheY-like chemotaxis protein